MLRISLTRLVKNLLILVNVAKDAEVGVGGGNCKDKTDKKLPRSKNLKGATDIITPNAK